MKRICLIIILTIWALSVFSSSSASMQGDSVGVKHVAGNTYIIYKISAGETVYSVSRKYQIPFSSIVAANPGVDLGAVKAGQNIYVPSQYTSHAAETVNSVEKYDTAKNENGAFSNEPARLNGTENTTSVHTEMASAKTHETVVTDNTETTTDISSSTLPVTDKNKPFATTFSEYSYKSGYVSNAEKGVATWIDGSNDLSTANERYYALHNSAPIGSVIKVRNLMNNRTIYAKVIGTLSEDEMQEKVMVKLSAGAAQKLNVLDSRFVVEVTYFIQQDISTSQK